MEIKAAKIEVDRIPQSLAIAKAPGIRLDPLDNGVEAFGSRYHGTSGDGGDDAVEVFFHHACDLLDRFKARTDGP